MLLQFDSAFFIYKVGKIVYNIFRVILFLDLCGKIIMMNNARPQDCGAYFDIKIYSKESRK